MKFINATEKKILTVSGSDIFSEILEDASIEKCGPFLQKTHVHVASVLQASYRDERVEIKSSATLPFFPVTINLSLSFYCSSHGFRKMSL